MNQKAQVSQSESKYDVIEAAKESASLKGNTIEEQLIANRIYFRIGNVKTYSCFNKLKVASSRLAKLAYLSTE